MLVLSRKPHESILIGDDIVITICGIGSTTVKVGIDAPEGIPIVRKDAKIKKGVKFRPNLSKKVLKKSGKISPNLRLFSE